VAGWNKDVIVALGNKCDSVNGYMKERIHRALKVISSPASEIKNYALSRNL
jgi:hypothetical protein